MAFENADSSSRVELIPSKIKAPNCYVFWCLDGEEHVVIPDILPVHLVPPWNERIIRHEMVDDNLREPRIIHLITLLRIFVFDLIDKVFPHQISIVNIPLVV
nr:hypothetical protein [Tanacetum cinerariifolium]